MATTYPQVYSVIATPCDYTNKQYEIGVFSSLEAARECVEKHRKLLGVVNNC